MSTSSTFWKSKTTRFGIAAVLVACAGALTGKLTEAQALQDSLVAILGILIRDTVAKLGEGPPE